VIRHKMKNKHDPPQQPVSPVQIKLLTLFKQPLTARQLSCKAGLPPSQCSYQIGSLADFGALVCLNPTAQNSRVYGLSESGRSVRQRYGQGALPDYHQPEVDWPLYGWLCYRHRAAVLKALTLPMQPSRIKRALRIARPSLRISANNIRDIIKQFRAKGLVEPVRLPNKAHLRYQLTVTGAKLRQVLIHAESPF